MAHYRSADELCAALAEAGFAAPEVVPGEGRSEEVWFVAEVAGAHGGETP